jgi:hypothetical protein
VSRKIENLYNRFKVMLVKRDDPSKNKVVALLKAIDEELAKKKTRFLTGTSAKIQWGPATGKAATVATATFYVVKDNKAEKIP